MMPLVSLVTPCYNLRDYISATIESIRAQTYLAWEWLIVDDGSVDETVPMVESVCDSRIKVIRAEPCHNLSVLRNIGAGRARGDILFFVDGDDLFAPTKVASQVEMFLRYETVQWCHTNAQLLIDETGERMKRGMPAPPDNDVLAADQAFASLLAGNYVYVSSVAVRRQAFESVGGFRESLSRSEDIDLWLRLAANGFDVGYLSEPLLLYRVRSSSLSASKTLEYLEANEVVYDFVKEEVPHLCERYRREYSTYRSRNQLKIGLRKVLEGGTDPEPHFRASVRIRPGMKNLAWWGLCRCCRGVLRAYVSWRDR